MRRRPITKFQPALEQFEEKQLLSAGALTSRLADIRAQRQSSAAQTDDGNTPLPHSFYVHRVTNTNAQIDVNLVPPLQQVLVQTRQPVPGQVYNVLQVTVRNGTAQTFTASNGFTVRLNTDKKQVFPILTGTQEWKPGQVIIFYIMTKKYYPLPQVYGGFQFDLGGRSSTAPPGPSGYYFGIKYNPATFARTLNIVVAGGPGNQGGLGTGVGIANTSINNIVAARTNRNDFAGHF